MKIELIREIRSAFTGLIFLTGKFYPAVYEDGFNFLVQDDSGKDCRHRVAVSNIKKKSHVKETEQVHVPDSDTNMAGTQLWMGGCDAVRVIERSETEPERIQEQRASPESQEHQEERIDPAQLNLFSS